MTDTLSESVLPGQKPDDGTSGAPEDTSKEPVSRAEFQTTQRMILDLSSKLDKGLAANRQSAHDSIKSEVSKASKDQRDFLIERLAGLLPKDGPSLDSLQREARLDALAAASEKPQGAQDESRDSSPSPASGVPLMQTEINAILKETGLVGDEPELQEFVREHKGKRWFEVGQEFYDLALKISARNRGSAAGIVPGAGARLPPSDLKDRYLAEISDMRKKRDLGLHRLTAVKDKYRKAGLANVDDIPLT